MLQKQLEAADAKNGFDETRKLPALTNDDVLMLLEYWQAQVKRNQTSWAGWYDVAKIALGYYGDGDKFKVDAKHAALWVPQRYLDFIWEDEFGALARSLDAEQTATKVKPARFSPTHGAAATLARFRRVAKAAWERMKRERTKTPQPPQKRPPRKGGRYVGAVVLLLALYALERYG